MEQDVKRWVHCNAFHVTSSAVAWLGEDFCLSHMSGREIPHGWAAQGTHKSAQEPLMQAPSWNQTPITPPPPAVCCRRFCRVYKGRPDLVLVAHRAAALAHAGQLAGAPVLNLHFVVLPPAVVAKGVPAAHCGAVLPRHVAEAAAARDPAGADAACAQSMVLHMLLHDACVRFLDGQAKALPGDPAGPC